MRKLTIPSVTETELAIRVSSRNHAPAKVVCLALMLALVTLTCRIATVW